MKYKSLHFDNEVINALYSPKDKKYWKFYMESFETQVTDNLEFIDKRPNTHDDYILETKKSVVNRVMSDLKNLVNDLLNTDYDSPLTQYIRMKYEEIELMNESYLKIKQL